MYMNQAQKLEVSGLISGLQIAIDMGDVKDAVARADYISEFIGGLTFERTVIAFEWTIHPKGGNGVSLYGRDQDGLAFHVKDLFGGGAVDRLNMQKSCAELALAFGVEDRGFNNINGEV